ncbi:MAG: alkaline phosphatase family protein [Nitrososphaerales archaeon]|jgi:predicted AlkP superfamily phosphohydrolase/phosphomutase
MEKVAVIGLDSVPPELLFDKLLDKLPNIKQMYKRGLHGKLRTCDPPITVPAWMVMMTGKSPGQLGIYGFRHRKGFSYNDGYIVNSTHVKERTVWEILSAHGRKSIVLGVPPGYPPKPVPNALVVSCFITPSIERPFTYPAELREEVLKAAGGKYVFDVTFRTEDRDAIKEELFDMTRKRFDVAEHLVKSHPWDFFIMHEIGFDRLHHAFWKFFDPAHPKYVPGNKYEKIDEEYYGMVDDRIGRLLHIFGDECLTFVLSDHGSKAMKGGFCVNQWLEREGYLVFKNQPSSITDIEKAEIDWTKTRAWGWGGYYARIFFNVKGREAQGVIEPSSYEKEKKRLVEKMLKIEDREGNAMGNQVFEPESLYHGAIGDKPDLMVYFGNLDWRSAGTVGHEGLYLSENDTGPDDSVHSMDGVMMMYDPRRDLGAKEIRGANVRQIAPILLGALGLDPVKEGIEGRTPDGLMDYLSR